MTRSPPPPPALSAPLPYHPSRAPEPLRLNLVPHSSGTAREPAPQQEPPRRGSDAPEGRLVHGEGTNQPGPSQECLGLGVRMERCREGQGRRPVLGDTRSLGSGGALLCARGGASPQTGQLSKGCPLGQLRFSSGTAGTRGRGGSGAPGSQRVGTPEESEHPRERGRATCPGGLASKGRGARGEGRAPARHCGRPRPGGGSGEQDSLTEGRRLGG